MDKGGLRNIEQIQERDGDDGGKLGGLVLASLGCACLVFAGVALLRKPTSGPVRGVDPLTELASRAPAASSGHHRELSAHDITFPGMLSDSQQPTTALAAISGPGTIRSASAPLPFELPPGAPTAPPPPGDRLPVVPIPAQRVLSASSIVTDPRDPLTSAAKERSTLRGEMAEEGRAGAYNLQVASFKSKEEAQAFATMLRQRGHKTYVESADIPNRGTWHRVRIGPFKYLRDANRYRAEFEAKEHIVPFVVETEKEKKLAEQREQERRLREARQRR